jgi:hypothetical protein
MTQLHKSPHPRVRLGSTDPSDRVREALANVRLDGLNPSPRAIELAYAVAVGSLTADEAVAEICSCYTSKQSSSS